MSKRTSGKGHKVRRTILIVGEGYAEIALLEYIKRNYHPRESGFTVKLGNARGKGAVGVIRYAKRQARQIDYDLVAVLFDTDTDWNEEVRQDAIENGLHLFPSDPCLEAEMLRLHGVEVQGSTIHIKKQFRGRYSDEANGVDHARHFSVSVIDAAIDAGHLIGDVVQLLKTGRLQDKETGDS